MSHSAATSSSASPAAVFNESSSIDEGEVSSDLANHSDDEDDNSTSDEEADDDDDDDFDIESIFRRDARDIQNRTSRAVGTVAMEDRRFRELFGASISIVLHVWSAMEECGLLPKKSRPKHLLWTLYFLKVYPREAAGCSAVGGGGGAIDPKTLRKWVWLMIERIGELADDVVSIYFFYFASR
jgi:hypothetical protein